MNGFARKRAAQKGFFSLFLLRCVLLEPARLIYCGLPCLELQQSHYEGAVACVGGNVAQLRALIFSKVHLTNGEDVGFCCPSFPKCLRLT